MKEGLGEKTLSYLQGYSDVLLEYYDPEDPDAVEEVNSLRDLLRQGARDFPPTIPLKWIRYFDQEGNPLRRVMANLDPAWSMLGSQDLKR